MRLLHHQQRFLLSTRRHRHTAVGLVPSCCNNNNRNWRQRRPKSTSSLHEEEQEATPPSPPCTNDAATTTTIKNIKPFSEIPGDWKSMFPVVGVVPMFLPYFHRETGGMRVEDFLYDYYEKYGKETGIAQYGPPGHKTVLVFDEGYLEVFRNETKSYPSGIFEPNWPIKQYNSKYLNGLRNPFLQKGEEWRKGRLAINPYLFNQQAAQSYVPAINEAARNAVDKYFERFATTGRFDKWCELTAFDMFTAAALGIQTNSVAGQQQQQQQQKQGASNYCALADDIIGGLGNASYLVLQCPYSKQDIFKFRGWNHFVQQWSKGRKAGKELLQLAMDRQQKTNPQGTGSIMQGFLNDPNLQISDEEATEMYLMLTFAAADTTSSLIGNVVTNLATYPRIQERLRAELQERLGGQDYHPDAKLPYLEQVLKESQRLTPPLPWVNVKGKITQEDLVVNGYEIPSRTTVIFSHMGIAHNPELVGNSASSPPNQFDPDRFNPSNIAARKGTRAQFLDHPVACRPFGFGARMCVGSRIAKIEYTSLLCRLLQDYGIQFRSDDTTTNNHNSPSAATTTTKTIRISHTTTTNYPCPTFQVIKI